MKFKELKNMSKEEVQKKMNEIKKELMQDYAQISAGTPPKSPGMLRQRKKTIARILTLKKQQEVDVKQ